MSKLQLKVVSQERQLLDTLVDGVTATSTSGEITILPDHIPLFSQLNPGELRYLHNGTWESIVVSKGFISVGTDETVTVLVDSAVHAREISQKKAEEAIKQAHETMKLSQDKRQLILAEASLRRAMLELKVARKTKRA